HDGRRRAAERRERPAHLARQRGRLPCGGAERTQPGEPPAAPEGERALAAVGDDERLVVAGRGQEVPGRERRQVDARRREPGTGEQRPVRLTLVASHCVGESCAPTGTGTERLDSTGVARSSAPPSPSSTPSVSSTARGSAGAVHAAFHSRPSKQRTRNVRTPARAGVPAGSRASGGAKRPPSRRTSTPGPGAAVSTR